MDENTKTTLNESHHYSEALYRLMALTVRAESSLLKQESSFHNWEMPTKPQASSEMTPRSKVASLDLLRMTHWVINFPRWWEASRIVVCHDFQHFLTALDQMSRWFPAGKKLDVLRSSVLVGYTVHWLRQSYGWRSLCKPMSDRIQLKKSWFYARCYQNMNVLHSGYSLNASFKSNSKTLMIYILVFYFLRKICVQRQNDVSTYNKKRGNNHPDYRP